MSNRDHSKPAADALMRDGAGCHRCDISYPLKESIFACPHCGKGLDIVYDYAQAAGTSRRSPRRAAEEHLALRGAAADRRRRRPGTRRRLSGYTPLIRAERLGAELGIANLFIKDESTARPSFSYKDRVVRWPWPAARARQERDRLRLDRQRRHGGRLAGAAAGVESYVCYPNRLERKGARLPGARRQGLPGRGQLRRGEPPVPRSRGNDRHRVDQHHPAPVLRRGREDRRLRDRRAARDDAARPRADSRRRRHALLRFHKGLNELELLGLAETDRTRIHIAQPSGCDPIASAIVEGRPEIDAVVPETLAHSLAIGAPNDGYLVIDAALTRGGTADIASDAEIFARSTCSHGPRGS